MDKYIITSDTEEFEILCEKRKSSVSIRAAEFKKICNEYIIESKIDEQYKIMFGELPKL